jgi:signal peptidase I
MNSRTGGHPSYFLPMKTGINANVSRLNRSLSHPYNTRPATYLFNFSGLIIKVLLIPMNSETVNEDLGLQSVLYSEKPHHPPVDSPRRRAKLTRFQLHRIIQQLGQCALILIITVGAYFFITRNIVQAVKVSGVSMVPTLAERQEYLLERWAFHSHEPQRLDVVVITDPGDHGLSVKRIIGLPGEMVHIKHGKVTVNFKELKESYLLPGTLTFTYSQAKEQLIACGPNHYFVMGDNRPMSIDSRAYGPVPRQNILGLVMLR